MPGLHTHATGRANGPPVFIAAPPPRRGRVRLPPNHRCPAKLLPFSNCSSAGASPSPTTPRPALRARRPARAGAYMPKAWISTRRGIARNARRRARFTPWQITCAERGPLSPVILRRSVPKNPRGAAEGASRPWRDRLRVQARGGHPAGKNTRLWAVLERPLPPSRRNAPKLSRGSRCNARSPPASPLAGIQPTPLCVQASGRADNLGQEAVR